MSLKAKIKSINFPVVNPNCLRWIDMKKHYTLIWPEVLDNEIDTKTKDMILNELFTNPSIKLSIVEHQFITEVTSPDQPICCMFAFALDCTDPRYKRGEFANCFYVEAQYLKEAV